MNELRQRFVAAGSFIAELGENVSALQKCITVVSQNTSAECFEFDIARRAQIDAALQAALADLRQSVRRLIVANARTRLP